MNASNKAGMPLPFAYLRYKVAERWCVPPWMVDIAPKGELAEALELMRLDGSFLPPAARH